MLFWNKNGAEAPKKKGDREPVIKESAGPNRRVLMIYRRRASAGMALYALLTDQIQQVAIGLLYAGSGIFRMTDFFKNGLQQHAILILLFSKQRQKTQG